MARFEEVLDLLPKAHVFYGELVVLDDAGRTPFNDLLFGRCGRLPPRTGLRWLPEQ
jgi:hypothetical protein